jgi:hypothetical protein
MSGKEDVKFGKQSGRSSRTLIIWLPITSAPGSFCRCELLTMGSANGKQGWLLEGLTCPSLNRSAGKVGATDKICQRKTGFHPINRREDTIRESRQRNVILRN